MVRLKTYSIHTNSNSVLYFRFCKIFRPGMFHCSLNKEILDMEQKMPELRNVDDQTSKAGLKTRAGIRNVTNVGKVIQDKNYELHRQYSEAVGERALLCAWKEYLKTLSTEEKTTKTKENAEFILKKFVKVFQFNYYFDQEYEPDYFDDCHKDALDNANRTILSKLLRKAVKQSDGKGVRASSLALIPFFLNRGLVQNSKYAAMLLMAHIEYLRASTKLKDRLDRYVSVNTKGGWETGIAKDMQNEFYVDTVKKLLKNLKIKTSYQADRAILDLPVSSKIVENDLDAVGMKKEGQGTSYAYLTEENLQEMDEVFEEVNPFSQDRDKITFQQDMPAMFEGPALSDENLVRFLARNRYSFHKSRIMRHEWKC